MRASFRTILCTLICGLWAATVFAQTERGAIIGTISDSNGGVLPGASVTVTNNATSSAQTYVTNGNGVYEAPFLTPGTYRVQVELAGFASAEVKAVEVNMGARIDVSLALQAAGVKTEVTVHASPPLVQTASAAVGQTVDGRTLTQLPSGDRNVYDFLAINSTVTAPAGGNAPAFRLESGGSFSVSGTRPSSVTFKIDGLANTDPGFGTPTITPSLDSVQEFQVQNNAYSAEYEGIGQVNVATRSGSQQVRGSLFEFFRNEALQPTNPVLHRKTKLRFNQFGGTVGGPVWPAQHTFFFFSYEGRRQDTRGPSQTFVPTTAYRSGDFSAALGACVAVSGRTVPLLGTNGLPTGDCVHTGQIFDPATTMRNPAFDASQPVSAFNPQYLRQPFPGNRIPTARLNQTVQQAIAAQIPVPNFGDALNNYTGVAGALNNNDQYSVRVDHTLSDTDHLYARLAIQNNIRDNEGVIPYTTKNLQGKGRVFSATWSRMFGAASVNELRVGYVRGIYGDSIDQIDPAQFGFDNTTLQTLPRFFINPGNLNYGGFSASVLQETQDTYQFADNFSMVRGRHALKAGLFWTYNKFNNTEFGGSNGAATFSGLYTTGSDALTATRENALADFMLGMSQTTSLSIPQPAIITAGPWAAYVQDDWKVGDRLTVSAGLRYEYHQPWKGDNGAGAAMDLSGDGRLYVVDQQVATLSNTPLVVCCASSRAVKADKNDFAPRVSAVFKPFAKDETWIRAGYGLFYSDMTQFFAWGSYTPLRGQIFQGSTGDFTRVAATVPDLFPSTSFLEGGGVIPFLQSGVPAAIHGPAVIGVGGVLDINNRTPYSHQWSVSVQRELLPQMLLDVTYQGSLGRNLPTQWIFNQPEASPTPASFTSASPAANPFLRRPYACCTSSSFVNANILESHYNALTVKVDKRFAHGFQLLSTYTYSRSIDEGSEVFQVGNTFNILSDSRHIERDRGRSTFDVPHRWVTSGAVELPFGQGRRWLDRGGVLDALAGGWQLSGIFTLESGFPFTPLIRNRLSNTGYSLATERGDLVGDPYFSEDEFARNVDEWKHGTGRLYLINPESISLDYAPGTFGNIPRNFFRAPFGRRLDFSLSKTAPMPRGARLQVRVDVINATSERLHRLDVAQFVAANNLLTNATVGSIPPYANMFNPRIIQLGLRLTF